MNNQRICERMTRSARSAVGPQDHDDSRESKATVHQGLKASMHGNIFQLKLLILFMVQGVLAHYYKFKLGTEMEELAGKFDDLVFEYPISETKVGYLYLQAKHMSPCKTSVGKITGKKLMSNAKKAIFGLVHYYISYVKTKRGSTKVARQDYVICTNIKFDTESLERLGITLQSVTHPEIKILNFLKFENYDVESYKLVLSHGCLEDIKNAYERRTKQKVKDIELNKFFNELIFVVNMPNEEQLDNVIDNELKRYYLKSSDFHSAIVYKEMQNWFKSPESKFMSCSEGKKILESAETKIITLLVIDASMKYQKSISPGLFHHKVARFKEFEDNAIGDMAIKLKEELETSTNSNGVICITSPSPRLSALKVFAGLNRIKQANQQQMNPNIKEVPITDYEKDDCSFLTISSDHLAENKLNLERAMDECQRHLVVVCEENCKRVEYEEIPKSKTNKVIIVEHSSTESTSANHADNKYEIKYNDFSEDVRLRVEQRRVTFQNTEFTAQQLNLLENPDPVLIEELIYTTNPIIMPSFDTHSFDFKLYINRNLSATDASGVEVGTKRDETVIKDKNERLFIVCGDAGYGKSTLLSYAYKEIKGKQPSHLVIRINLLEHVKRLEALIEMQQENQSNYSEIDFLVAVMDSKIAKYILRHYLENKGSGNTVLLLDDLDDVDKKLRDQLIVRIKDLLNRNERVKIYITARNVQLRNSLTNEFNKGFYALLKFTYDDIKKCMSQIWKTKTQKVTSEALRSLADTLHDLIKQDSKLSQLLNGETGDFLGNPMHCRMLAESFTPESIETLKTWEMEKVLKKTADYYQRVIDRRVEVYESDTRKLFSNRNWFIASHVANLSRSLRNYANRIAISTRFRDKFLNLLLHSNRDVFQSDSDVRFDDIIIKLDGIRSGLFNNNDRGELELSHSTYTDYMVAAWVFDGLRGIFAKNENHQENVQHNSLLDYIEIINKTVIEILVNDSYKKVRIFLDSLIESSNLKSESDSIQSFQIHQNDCSSCDRISRLNECIFNWKDEHTTYFDKAFENAKEHEHLSDFLLRLPALTT